MENTVYGLYKKSFVDENGNMTEEKLITYHNDINEIWWFKGKYNYCNEDYFICEIEKFGNEWQQIDGTNHDY